MTVVDIHSHFVPLGWQDPGERYGGTWPWVRGEGDPSRAMIMLGKREFRPIESTCWEAERRLESMESDGVDLQVVSATPVFFAYDKPVEQALDVARRMNDAALELAGKGRGRLFALCQVPLQDTDAACRELSRCLAAGHVGVQIGNHVGPRNMDDPGIVDFLRHCAVTGAPVLVHPWDMMGSDRTSSYMMGWTVGMPAETQLGIVSMILGGAFDRLPRELKICFAHGGGSFAFLLGRLENAWLHRDVARGKSLHRPSAYLDRFHVDSAVFDPAALQFLVGCMGVERVMLGSDYPFPLGEERVGRLIREAFGGDVNVRSHLLGANALDFFGLSAQHARLP
jgi:aminocarboxymuconate-semialdehyde decarboxylase